MVEVQSPPTSTLPNNSPANLDPLIPPACNINRYLHEWNLITKDKFVINVVKFGYNIQFLHTPFQSAKIFSFPSSLKLPAIREQVSHHLKTGAISVVSPSKEQHVYRIFTVKKANGKDRMVIDLSPLNKQILKVKFRMEDDNFIRSMLSPNDLMVSIDLADAFFSIPISKYSKKFINFEVEGVRYQFNSLPFGLSSSPRVFTKILKPVISYLRRQGIKASSYLDDIFLCASSKEILHEHVSITLELLSSLGFTVNFTKSNLIPSKEILHLGYIWNSE